MAVLGVKLQQWPWPQRSSHLGQFFVILILLFLSTSFVNCQHFYPIPELDGLQALWSAWNTSTPDSNSSLAGWNSSQPYPCQNLDFRGEVEYPIWRGVKCNKMCSNMSEEPGICSEWDVHVIGLTLSNASITGILPPVFENLSSLTTLELTGNPELSGALPENLELAWLNVLDLRDNAFDGTVPVWDELWSLLYLDLSGNKLTGEFPIMQLSSMDVLEQLSIGRNQFKGVVPKDAFQNKTKLETLDISNNDFTGALPDLTRNTRLLHLDVSGNHFEGLFPDLTNFPTLRTVILGRNNFTGTTNLSAFLNVKETIKVDLSYIKILGTPQLPLSWKASDLGSIEELYLDGNNITGILDITQIFLAGPNGTLIGNLRIMSLMNNGISDVKYDKSIIDNNNTVFKLQGNPYCDGDVNTHDGKRCFCSQICFNTPVVIKSDNRNVIIISATTSVVAAILILLIVVGAILLKNRRYRKYLRLQFQQKFEEFDVKPTIYSYNELRAATRDFHEENKLGQGSYGAVYKGVLPNGHVVAVKQLFIKTAQGLDEFSNEIVLITGMKHRNLVNLKGCCLRETSRILVYEYVDNYDVDQILLGPEKQVVSWPMRLKICLGIARGLHYLHALAHPRVIHRDIKASNILLDKHMEPKIADFGLALLFPDEESHIMTIHVAGTKGYLAPEYASLGQLSDKVDVYSFGVLVLEIISGRRNIDESLPLEQVYLSQWAWKLHEENRVMGLVDASLTLKEEEKEDVQRVIKTALLCIQNAAEKRPTMTRIVSILQSDTQSEVTVLSGKGEPLKRSYESRKSLKLLDDTYDVGVENQPHRSADLTVNVELGTIRAR